MNIPDAPVPSTGPVLVVVDGDDGVTASEPVTWAVAALQEALDTRGIPSTLVHGALPSPLPDETAVVVVAGGVAPASGSAGVAPPDGPEGLVLGGGVVQGRKVLLASGSDARGLVYAVLELADRIANAPDPRATIDAARRGRPTVGRPTNEVRSAMRVFASDVEDGGWFHDRGAAAGAGWASGGFWQRYLTALATHRFNRFHLALGVGYDFARAMRDTELYFPYPFLVDVPGYDVRASGVSDAERERNLASLRFIGAETKRRGLHFQLGVWANVYVFEDSPQVNHTIEGLTPATHAPYCRDALRALLQAVPEIDGVTLRIHGESGIPEGSYDFWETLFAGIAGCGRRVEMDLHSKGIDQRMIDLALATGQPVTVSPKFWAEHLGLPYHQAEIRAVEQPGEATGAHARLMALSIGSRRFTRYGYADLLKEVRPYGIVYRIWPGTHRLLLWGDPVTGRAYSRAFTFGGARGVDLFEPLSFSGRRGSGLPSGRDPYADATLRPGGAYAEWQKYAYSYRLWGRLLYDPAADAEQWRRAAGSELGGEPVDVPADESLDRAAPEPAAAAALACASRILPLVTTAYLPSAANNSYWPEIYTSMPIVDGGLPHPYRDSPTPRRFGTVSPLDPALFCSVEEYVAERLGGGAGAPGSGTASPTPPTPPTEASGRHGPLEVARWLDALAEAAGRHLDRAASRVADAGAPAFRRLAIDVRIEAALGRYFAGALRAATGYALFGHTADVGTLADALAHYDSARDAWTAAGAAAAGAYKRDLTFGPEPHLRGHWSDRLAAIDADRAAMAARLEAARRDPAPALPRAPRPTLAGLLDERPPDLGLVHRAPVSFAPGQPLDLAAGGVGPVSAVRLYYRHLTQAERFNTLDLLAAPGTTGAGPEGPAGLSEGATFRGRIPAAYTDSPYPLQYYFVLRDDAGRARLWPGVDGDGPEPPLASQPYVVVRRAGVDVTAANVTAEDGERTNPG